MTCGRRLLVVGDVVADVVAAAPDGLNPGTDASGSVSLRPGGSGANTAAWASECGAEVELLAAVGERDAGWHGARLRAAGVRPRLRTREQAGAVVLALTDAAGERTMLTDRGAAATLAPQDWRAELLDGVAAVHLSGYLWFAEPGRELAGLVMEQAAARGLSVSVDPASTGFLGEYGPDRFLADVEPADLLLPNAEEAMLLTGADDPGAAAATLSRGRAAAVTLGADGAIAACDGDVAVRLPAVAVAVVDAVGAGDAFAGGFLAARLGGRGLAAAAEAGAEAAARAVAVAGGRPI